LTEKKPDRRSELMKKRMADPAFRAKALATLAKGRAALGAKRATKIVTPASTTPETAAAVKSKKAETPAAPPKVAGTRSFGVGRWRGA